MGLLIGWEPFASMWPDAEPLALAHWSEVEGPLAEKRPCRLNVDMMNQAEAAGVLKVITARLDGQLLAYATFSIMPDIESMGLLLGNQGAIYASPGYAHLNLSSRMIDFAIEGLRALGVKPMLLHHRLLGRGKKMGVLFRRKKATPIKHEYYLWIGD